MHRSPIWKHKLSALTAAATLSLLAAAPAHAVALLGLTTNNALSSFDSAAPANGSTLVGITGLEGTGQRIVGIDLRPTTGIVYGISSDSKLYTLNAVTGVASKVADLSMALSGTAFGIDFNPVADLAGAASLRITSDNGTNFAVNVNSGAAGTVAAQTALTFGGASIGATAAAYSNNDVDPATGTTLYYLDTASDGLYQTAAPAGGVLTKVGNLGLNASAVNGFDIGSFGNLAFAALSVEGASSTALYSINLATGAATSLGAFGIAGSIVGAPQLAGLTVSAIPEPQTYALMLAGLAAVGVVARRRTAKA
jgi:hypothetical protein